MTEQKLMTITICMGSSCYSRGNGRNIEAIEDFIATRGLDAQVELVGHLCEDACRNGPNIRVNGKTYQQVNAAAVVEILREGIANTGDSTGVAPRGPLAVERPKQGADR